MSKITLNAGGSIQRHRQARMLRAIGLGIGALVCAMVVRAAAQISRLKSLK